MVSMRDLVLAVMAGKVNGSHSSVFLLQALILFQGWGTILSAEKGLGVIEYLLRLLGTWWKREIVVYVIKLAKQTTRRGNNHSSGCDLEPCISFLHIDCFPVVNTLTEKQQECYAFCYQKWCYVTSDPMDFK